MADDIQSNIKINVDTASAMDSIRLLQNQISAFHTQMSKMGAAQAADARNLQQNLVNSINSTGAFTANMTKVKTTAEQFTTSLERNKLSMGEYFRYAGGASKTFGRAFQAEFQTINKVARERVKDLQSQYIKLGRDANGAMQAIRVRPLVLDMDNLATRTQIAAQRQQLLNQLLKQGSTNLLNFGKNTQWAGRQLMVGFTIPLSIMGAAAMKSYKEIEEAGIRLKRVYGDFGTTNVETEKMVKDIQRLALEYTKYGVAVKDSMQMAADAAAMGKKGADLLAQVSSSARLAVLGGVDQQMALKTTTSLTDAFGVSTKQLAKDINFLNAVENQTVLSIEDMTIAIPKAAPVIQQLGGDVKDLAFFLTAMKEGGINASESANALKSGLASLINPTNTASKMLQGFGINLREIVQGNKGDVKKTVVDFAQALDKLDPLNRAKAIEQLFGKFQFARMSTLFKNVIEQGSQASQVLKLASASSLELSMLAQRELNKIESSPLFKFQKSIADFQAALAPVGEQFMKALTPIINFGTDVLNNFNNLGEGVKGFIVKFVAVAGVVGPVLLMSFGLIANAVANVIKGFALMKDIFNKTGKSSLSLGEQVNYMTQEQIQAAAIASSLDQVHSKLKQTFTSEAAAVDALTAAYQRSVAAQRAFAVPITPRGPVRKLASGGFVTGPGTGTSDSIPAMLSNGEAVIPAKSVAQNRDLVQSLINDSLPRFAKGGIIGGPSESLMQQVKGTSAVIAYGAHQPFTTAHQGIAQMGMSMAEQSGMPFFQFTSNQGKAKRSLLSDDLKSRMISEAIGRNPEFAKNPFELMAMLSKAGIKDVNILLGEDRMKSPVWDLAAKEYGINLSKTGVPRPAGSPSGTMARAAAAAGNVGMFESLLASGVSKSTRGEVFKNLLAAATGKVRKFSNGGMISGPGTGTSDSILARVSNGEAIIPAASVARNPSMVRQLISGNIPGFNQGFIDEISGRGRNASTQSNISAILSSEISKIRTRSEMYGYDADRVVGEFISHIRNSSENIDKLTQANIKAMVRNNPERITYSPNSGQQQTTQFAHVGGNATITAQEALSSLNLAPSKRANLEMVAAQNPSQPVNVYHGFGFKAKGSINEQMAKAGADLSEMVDDFGSRGVDKWRDAVKNGGGNFEQLISQATAYDNQVLSRLQESQAQGATKIVDTQKQIDILRQKALASGKQFDSKQYIVMEQIHNNVVTDLKMLGTELDGVFNSARQTIRDVRYRIPSSMHGVPGIFEGTGRGPEKPNVRVEGRNLGTMPTASQSAIAGQASGTAFLNAQKAVLDKPQNDPAMISRDGARRNSPHSQAPIDGKDDGVAYSQARTNAIAAEEAKAATKRSRRVTSEGPWITPGQSQSQQLAIINERQRGGRVRTEGESFLPENMVVVNPNNLPQTGLGNLATDPSEMMTARKLSFKERMQMLSKPNYIANRVQRTSLDDLTGSIRNKSFGASGGLAVGSMVVPGQAGQLMGMASMLTSFGGMGAGTIAKGMKSLSKETIGLGLKFLKFVPYVGAAVIAFEAFDNFIMPLIKKNSKAYEAIANTLSITQNKLDKINSFFGTDLKLTGVRGTVIASGDQTKEEASIAKQFQQSQEFKDLYEQDAKEMSKLTNQQFKRAMEAMAMDLSGQGLEPEGVTAIIDAIAISAGKTRVSVDPKLFSIANAETKTLMQQNIKSAFSQISEGSRGISPEGTFNPTGRTLDAATGAFDAWYLTPVDPESIAKVKAGTEEIASYMSALSGQFANGEISAKEFNIEYSKLISISKQQPGTSGLEAMKAAMISLNAEIGHAIKGLGDLNFPIWQKAIIAGVSPTKEALDAAAYGGKEVQDAFTKNFEEALVQLELDRSKEQKLKKQINDISSSSTGIANTEQKVNDKYNKRIEQLEKIKTLNEQLAKSQQGQLTLAEALNKGDIAAAARAAVDIQNNDIQASLDNQKTGLEEARKAELEPLKNAQTANTAAVNKLTKEMNDLSTEGVVVKNPEGSEGKTGPKALSKQGNDVLGYLNYGASWAMPLVSTLSVLFEKGPQGFLQGMVEKFLPPGTALTQDGKIVPQRMQTAEPQGNANGGFIRGPGSGTSDSIPAMLSNGEYVIRANAVKTIGVDTLNKLNQADRLGFAAGGMVRAYRKGGMVGCPCGTPGCPGCSKGYAMGGMVRGYDEGGLVQSLFGDTQGWFNNLISGMFNSGGNPSAGLDATAADAVKTGAKGFSRIAKIVPRTIFNNFSQMVFDEINPWSWFSNPSKKEQDYLDKSMTKNNKIYELLAKANDKDYIPVSAGIQTNNLFGIPNPFSPNGAAYGPTLNKFFITKQDMAARRGTIEHEFGHALDINLLPNPDDIFDSILSAKKPLHPAQSVSLNPLRKVYSYISEVNRIDESPVIYLEEVRAEIWQGVLDRLNKKQIDDQEEVRAYSWFDQKFVYSKPTPGLDNIWQYRYNMDTDKVHTNPQVGGAAYLSGYNDPVGFMKMLGLQVPAEFMEFENKGKTNRFNFNSDNEYTRIPENMTYDLNSLKKKFPGKKVLNKYAKGGLVGYKDGGIVESLFGNTQNWLNNVILSMFGSGGNPSAALNATAEDMTRTGIKEGQSFVKDYIFDPTNPVDIAMTAVPGLKPAKAVAKKAADALGFSLVLKPKVPTPELAKFNSLTSLGATPGGIKKIDGKNYYVKKPSGQPDLVGEMLGSTIWNKLGLGGPKLQMVSPSLVASKIIPNLTESNATNMSKFIDDAPNKIVGANTLLSGLKDYVKNQLPANSLLGNVDTHSGNIMLDKKTGKFHNIDLGITNLSSYASSGPAKSVMYSDFGNRMHLTVEAMKRSGFNARQINDLFKKNGFSPLDEQTINSPYGPKGFNSSFFENTRKKQKNFSQEIESISKILGFDLSKPIDHKTNAAVLDAKNNKLIQNMIKQNPELEQWLGLGGGKTGNTNALINWTVSQNLGRTFEYLQNAAKDPIFKYAEGGLVGYNEGGPVKPKPRDPGGWDAQGKWHPTSYFDNLKKMKRERELYEAEQKRLGNPSGDDIMSVAKNMAYFTPVIGAGTLIGDSASSFSKGDVAGGIFNAAGAALGGVGPKLFEKIGGFKPVQDFFNTLMKPVAAVAKPIIKVATPAAQAASNAAMRTAFRLGAVGIEQGTRSAATHVPSFMKSTMVLENNLPEINTNLKYINYSKYIKPTHPNTNLYATNLLRERYGSDYPLVHFNSNPGAVSKRVKPQQKTGFLETMAKIAKNKVIKPVRTVARDAATLAAAKSFGMQTKNIPPLINTGKGTTPSLEAAKAMLPKMRIGKDNKLEMNAANSDYDLADMYDAEGLWEIPEELLVGLQGTIVNTRAALYGDRKVGSVSGNIFDADKGLTAQDIFVQLEEAYRGKGIAQRFTTQFIELLKNMGVKNIDIDAAMTDGGYAWARANFKFTGRPTNIIQRMEALRPLINNQKFDKLLESLKTADIEDLPMPKEILGLKANWRKYFSEEELIKQVTTIYSPMAISRDITINPNTNSLGELIMRGSKWQGTKEIGKGSKLSQFFDTSLGIGKNVFDKTKGLASTSISKFKDFGKALGNDFKSVGLDIKKRFPAPKGPRVSRDLINKQKQEALEFEKRIKGTFFSLVKKGEIGTWSRPDYYDFAERGSKIIKESLSPNEIKMPEMFEGLFTNWRDLTPEQIKNIVMSQTRFGKASKESFNDLKVIFSNRPAVKQTNPIIDFLWSRGMIKTPRYLQKTFDEQAKYAGLDAAIPQVGLSPQIVFGNNAKYDGFAPAGLPGSNYSSRIGNSFSKLLPKIFKGLEPNYDVGPFSTYIGSKTLKSNPDVYRHESAHILQGVMNELIRTRSSKLAPGFLSPQASFRGIVPKNILKEMIRPHGATYEAAARVQEAILDSKMGGTGTVGLYNQVTDLPRLMRTLQSSTPAGRHYQTNYEWFRTYLKSIYSARKETGLPIHSDEDIARTIEMTKFLKQNTDQRYVYAQTNQERAQAIADRMTERMQNPMYWSEDPKVRSEFDKLQSNRDYILNSMKDIKTASPIQKVMSSFATIAKNISKNIKKPRNYLRGFSSDVKYWQSLEGLNPLQAIMTTIGNKFHVFKNNKTGKPVDVDKMRRPEATPEYYANGGLVGGMMSIPEPAPRQFANGGMVRAATGGMLINGKFLRGFANGGMVPAKFAMGGYAMGTDTVPAMLTPGEFVIKKSAVDRIGPSTLNKINKFAEGGLVGGMATAAGESVYNNNTYEINVNVSSNSNPDQIANAVMTKIRQIDNKRVRGSAF
jgi:TP901 family phage tail tape measure protein